MGIVTGVGTVVVAVASSPSSPLAHQPHKSASPVADVVADADVDAAVGAAVGAWIAKR